MLAQPVDHWERAIVSTMDFAQAVINKPMLGDHSPIEQDGNVRRIAEHFSIAVKSGYPNFKKEWVEDPFTVVVPPYYSRDRARRKVASHLAKQLLERAVEAGEIPKEVDIENDVLALLTAKLLIPKAKFDEAVGIFGSHDVERLAGGFGVTPDEIKLLLAEPENELG